MAREAASLFYNSSKFGQAVNTLKYPGRNEPCPCGSGKKFKKCHYIEFGKQDAEKFKIANSQASEPDLKIKNL